MPKNIPEDVEIQRQLTRIHIDLWKQNVVFHAKWWLLILLLILMLAVWWRLADKSKRKDICLFAGLITVIALGINEYGEELTLFAYPVDVIPVFPPLSSVNLFALPVVYSVLYGYFNTWKSYIAAALIASAVLCFVIEPVLSFIGIYHLLNWKYYYSFPIYFLSATVTRFIVLKAKKIEITADKNSVK